MKICVLWFMVILLLCISRASEIKKQHYSEEVITKNFQYLTLMQEKIESMTNKQLKNACKERGLGVKGKKETLQNRLLGLMKHDNNPKINILVECSCSCIWFIILGYVGIRDTINHLLVTNKTMYHNIIKFKFDDSKESMIKLLDLYPEIESYLMWISSHKPHALELFLNLRENYADLSFLSAVQNLFVNVHPIPSIESFMLVLNVFDNRYDFCVGSQTQHLILYDNNADEETIHSIVISPVNITLFFLFIFQDVQILYELGDIQCICIHEGEFEYAIYFTKIIGTEDVISIGLMKAVLDEEHGAAYVEVNDWPESWNITNEQYTLGFSANVDFFSYTDDDDYYFDQNYDIEIITDGSILTKIYIPNKMLLQNVE